MTRIKNRLFCRHFETVQNFIYLFILFYFILFYFILFYFILFYFNLFYFFFYFFFCRIVRIFYSPYLYGAYFIAKSRWESDFLKGGPWNPLGHQRE